MTKQGDTLFVLLSLGCLAEMIVIMIMTTAMHWDTMLVLQRRCFLIMIMITMTMQGDTLLVLLSLGCCLLHLASAANTTEQEHTHRSIEKQYIFLITKLADFLFYIYVFSSCANQLTIFFVQTEYAIFFIYFIFKNCLHFIYIIKVEINYRWNNLYNIIYLFFYFLFIVDRDNK